MGPNLQITKKHHGRNHDRYVLPRREQTGNRIVPEGQISVASPRGVLSPSHNGSQVNEDDIVNNDIIIDDRQ